MASASAAVVAWQRRVALHRISAAKPKRWRHLIPRSRPDPMAASASVVEALTLLSAELRAGVEPTMAVRHVAAEHRVLEPWALSLGLGIDEDSELRVMAKRPGCERLADLAAGWHVSQFSGAPLADVVERLVEELRDDLEQRREVARQIAPAKSTARLMALLPVLGFALSSGLSGVAVILASPIALTSVVLGLVLAATGAWWISRIVRSVERG